MGLCRVGALRQVLPFGGTRGTRPTCLCRVGALWWVLPFGGTQGPALRVVPRWCFAVGLAFRRDARHRHTFVPRLMRCGGSCLSAGREAPALRVCAALVLCGGSCISAGREAPPYGFVPLTYSNQLFISVATSLFIIHYSSFSTPRPTGLSIKMRNRFV